MKQARLHAVLAAFSLLAGTPQGGPVAAAEPTVRSDAAPSAANPSAAKPSAAFAAPPIEATPPAGIEDLRRLQEEFRHAVARARPATVAVEMADSLGSGVVVSPDGIVLTAGHVSVEPNRSVWVRLASGERLHGLSMGVNHASDMGLVAIVDPPPDESGWPCVPIAPAREDGSPVVAGEWVVALGHPNGYLADRAPPARIGRVLYTRDGMLCTDATLVGGDSGGPLLNLRGEVVAIHSRIGERITSNYHIASTVFREAWAALLAGSLVGVPEGEDPIDWGPLAGLAVRDPPAGSQGCIVTQVFPGSAAEEAGVRIGDIVTEYAGRPVRSLQTMAVLARLQQPYDRVPITVRRGAQTERLSLWLGRGSRRFPGGSADDLARSKNLVAPPAYGGPTR